MRKLAVALGVAALLSFGAPASSRAQTSVTVTADAPSDKTNFSKPEKVVADQRAENRSVSVGEFIAELSPLSNKLDDWDEEDHSPSKEELAKLRSSYPKTWTVQTDDGAFSISSASLDKALEVGETDDAEAWVDHALAEARSYTKPQGRVDQNARKELNKILGTSEFSVVHRPSVWDLFRQRLSAWIERLLGKLLGRIERYPIAGDILFWGILLLAVSFLARWLFSFLVSRDRMQALTHQELVVANRTWQEWIRLARGAAARQDFREAVHSAYWAGIARLEDLGMLPKDRTKTPREYLRVVPRISQQELAARPVTYFEPLKELTTRLERVWYANRGAKAEDFEETLRQLKALGCQLE